MRRLYRDTFETLSREGMRARAPLGARLIDRLAMHARGSRDTCKWMRSSDARRVEKLRLCQPVSLTHLLAWRTGPHAHTRAAHDWLGSRHNGQPSQADTKVNHRCAAGQPSQAALAARGVASDELVCAPGGSKPPNDGGRGGGSAAHYGAERDAACAQIVGREGRRRNHVEVVVVVTAPDQARRAVNRCAGVGKAAGGGERRSHAPRSPLSETPRLHVVGTIANCR